MKLEPDLLRDLLSHIETAANRPSSDLENIELAGWAEDAIAYHVILAEEAGLIRAHITEIPDAADPDMTHVSYIVQRLTFKGHEFIGATRTSDIWHQVKSGAQAAGTLTIGVMASIAEAALKKKLSDLTGLDLT